MCVVTPIESTLHATHACREWVSFHYAIEETTLPIIITIIERTTYAVQMNHVVGTAKMRLLTVNKAPRRPATDNRMLCLDFNEKFVLYKWFRCLCHYIVWPSAQRTLSSYVFNCFVLSSVMSPSAHFITIHNTKSFSSIFGSIHCAFLFFFFITFVVFFTRRAPSTSNNRTSNECIGLYKRYRICNEQVCRVAIIDAKQIARTKLEKQCPTKFGSFVRERF